MSIFRNYTLPRAIISLCLLLFFYLLILLFISQEDYVLSWGFADRYAEFIQIGHQLQLTGFVNTLKITITSIQNVDYNFLTALIISPLSLIFGTSRLTYILIILTTLFLPCFFLFLKLTDAFNPKNSLLQYFNLNLLFLLSSTILTPIIRNQPSIIGLIPIILIFIIFHQQKFNLSRSIILAILLAILPLFHRWYFYFSFNFLLYYTLFNLKNPKNRSFCLLTILLSIIFFISLSGQLWQRFFLTNYHQTYAFFRFSDNIFIAHINTYRQIGFTFIFIFLIINLLQKNYFYLLLFISITTEFLFIQDFNIQHYYLLIIPILSSFAKLILKNKNQWYQLLLFAIIIIHFNLQPIIDKTGTQTFLQIVSDFQQLSKTAQIYIVSNSRPINASAFQNYTCYFHPSSLCSQILPVSYLLARDGFPTNFSSADYFLVLDPETNTDPVIKDIRSQIIDNPHFYQQIKKYYLSPISKVWLYQKISL